MNVDSIFIHHNYKMRLITPLTKSFSQIINYQPSPITIRLSKLLSLKSVCSRRQAQDFIKLGLVRVDGKRIYQNMLVPYEAHLKALTPLGLQVNKPITKLWMMNKPRGYICTHRDPQNRKTIYELFPPQIQKDFGYLMSVGRLDFNSEGLLLVTNDNVLKKLLQNPEANLSRVYRVKVHGRLTPEKIQKMNKVQMIKGIPYGPLNVNVDRQLSTNSWLNVSLRTGKNREIRRIMQKCDLQVNKLIRTQYGPYKLGRLQHSEIAEIPLSQGLDRKLRITKAKDLKATGLGVSNCLIEIDIRERAIGLAKNEYQQKQLSTAKPDKTVSLIESDLDDFQDIEQE